MKTILLKDGMWVIEKRSNEDLYDCKYYEYYSSINQYRLICVDERCTKEYVEETFDIVL